MAQKTKIQLTRGDAWNLWHAMHLIAVCDVPTKFRYWVARNKEALRPEIKAIEEAYPEPDPDKWREYESKRAKATNGQSEKLREEFGELIERREKWKKEREEHFAESTEVEVFRVPIVEIDDPTVEEVSARRVRNQALIEALAPILQDESEERMKDEG
jgi:hypothetical protein